MSLLPNAIQSAGIIEARIKNGNPALFLDFDGTLTPIVARPELANLSAEMKKLLTNLSIHIPLGILSGRSHEDLWRKVQISEIYYGTCHGLELKGPDFSWNPPEIGPLLPLLKTMHENLSQKTQMIPKILFEFKTYSLALHYRQVATEKIPYLEKILEEQIAAHPGFIKTRGKMVFEILPDLPWDKGTALRQLQKHFLKKFGPTLPIFIGDDLTDENAFTTIQKDGIGIRVGNTSRKTAASYLLNDVAEVMTFLKQLAGWTR